MSQNSLCKSPEKPHKNDLQRGRQMLLPSQAEDKY
jgi:hypothetical protein